MVGSNFKELGGYCNEVRDKSGNVVSTNSEEWTYDTNTCIVYVYYENSTTRKSCIGEHTSPVGTEVSSFDHTDGTLTPTGSNRLFDTDIRFIDNDNNAIIIVTEWDSTLTSLLHVHILCDCSFEGDVTVHNLN